MKETFSNDFKKFFLLKFTEELIRHSEKKDITNLLKIIRLKEEERKKEFFHLKEEFAPKIERTVSVRKLSIPAAKPAGRMLRVRESPKPSLFISEPKLPEHLAYLKPVPTAGTEIDLFKLNPLIKDPAVRIIEVNPDEKVMVTGTMGTRPTGIIMNKEDINRVINKFSEISKIPVTEGVYKVVTGNLILSAIISDVIGSKFVIKKMAYPMRQQYQNPPIIPR
jgi:hypothetical protein